MQTNHAPAAQPLFSPTQKHIKTPLFVSPQTTPPPDAGSGKNAQPPYPQVPLIDLKTANRLWVQPNPASQHISIGIPPFLTETQTTLYLFNTQGKIIQQIALVNGEYTIDLSTHHLPNGIYFLSLIADGVRLAQTKLVVQH